MLDKSVAGLYLEQNLTPALPCWKSGNGALILPVHLRHASNLKLFEELKRRNVFRAGTAYLITAWLILQVGDVLLNNLPAPGWVMPAIILVLALGLPVTLAVSWFYELGPGGLVRDDDQADPDHADPRTGRMINAAIMGVLLLAVGVLLVDKLWLSSGSPPSAPDISDKSIAVLPFDNYSADASQAWFARGLAEETINVLARTPDLRVAARTSSFRWQDSDLSIPDIARRLGVAHVLEGSVRRTPERIRVTVQLVRAGDGFQVWSESYDRASSELIAIQEDIALSIARALQTAMDPDALERMLQAGTRSVEAFEQYLRGLAMTGAANAAGSFKTGAALDAFKQALDHDSGFAEAAYEAAKLYREMANTTIMVRSGEASVEALRDGFARSIQMAIDAAAHDAAHLKYQALQAEAGLRLVRAQSNLEVYLDQRPNDIAAWSDYSYVSRKIQDRNALQRAVEARLRLAPNDPLMAEELGVALVLIGFTKAGIEQFQRALELDPGSLSIQYQAHRAYLWAGMDEAAAELADSLLQSDLAPIYATNVRLRNACVRGDRSTAEAILATKAETDLFGRWYALKLLGEHRAAAEVLRPLDATAAGRDDLAGYLIYPVFDPSVFPNLSSALERQGIQRQEPVEFPFACPASTPA